MNKRIIELRIKNNYTKEEIARKLNIEYKTYVLYETGKKQIPIQIFSKLAYIYNTSIDYIIGETNNIKPFKKN